jgi:hypothetical protein
LPVVLVRYKFPDVVDRCDAAARDHGNLEFARELDCRLDIDAGQHAVAADVGVDDRFDAVVLELFREIHDVVTGHLRPAVRRDLAFAGIEPDDDMARNA